MSTRSGSTVSGGRPWRWCVVPLLAALVVGCGSQQASPEVRACVKRWNGSIAKTNALKDIAFGTEANIRVEHGRCTVILMGARKQALTFEDRHPGGVGGFLFAGSLDRKDLPPEQKKANADVRGNFALELKR